MTDTRTGGSARYNATWILESEKEDVQRNHIPRLSAASITPSAYLSPITDVPVTSGCLLSRIEMDIR